MNLKQMLEKDAAAVPHKAAVVFGAQRLTYQELDESSSKLANALIGLGMRKGEHVAMVLSSTIEWVVAYFGIIKSGCVAVIISPMLKAPECSSLLHDSDSKILLTEKSFSQMLASVLPDNISLKHVIEVDSDSYARMIADSSSVSPDIDIKDNDEATIIYTAGVLGKQAGIVHTHTGLISVLPVAASGIELEREDVYMTMVPLFYLLGLAAVLLVSLLKGSTMVILPRFTPRLAVETIEREKVTTLCGVPAMYNALAMMDDESLKRYNLSSLRVALTAGAKSYPHLMKALEDKFGLILSEIYGFTEFLIASMGTTRSRKLGTAGKPACDIRIIGDDGEEVRQGEMGEAVCKAPWVMKGYYKMPDLTAQVIKGGWFYTGDLVKMHDDDFLEYIEKKSFIVVTSAGVKIPPREVEEVLLKHPSVAEAVYVGVTDEHKGQIPTAFIVLREGQTTTAKEIRSHCHQCLADFKLPRRIKFRDSLPKTGSGEIDRLQLKGERVS